MDSIPWVDDPHRTPVILSLGLSLIAHAGLFAVLTQLAQMKQPPQPRPMIYIELVGVPGEAPAGRPDDPATPKAKGDAKESEPAIAQQTLPPVDEANKATTKNGEKSVAARSEPAADTPESASDLTGSDEEQNPNAITADLAEKNRKIQMRRESPDVATSSPQPRRTAAQTPPINKTSPSSPPRQTGSISVTEPSPKKLVKAKTAERANSADRTHKAVDASRGPDKKPVSNSGKAHEEVAKPVRFAGHGLNNPAPKYPYTARRLGQEGRVILRVTVSGQGFARSVAVISSSGHRILDQAALDAVQRWTFIPATRAGRPVQGFVDVPITFKLN